MNMNQNETGALGPKTQEANQPHNQEAKRLRRQHPTPGSNLASRPVPRAFTAFTLVELLIVIAIIGVLASLITAAAFRAVDAANRAAIKLEIDQISNALAEFKNEYGAYPPNVFPGGSTDLGLTPAEINANGQRLVRALRKAFPRSSEFNVGSGAVTDNVSVIANDGLSPAEALVFWLQGFSSDPARPLSGTDLTVTTIEDINPVDQSTDTVDIVLTMDTYRPRYEFDKGRLRISRNADGTRRFLSVQRENGDTIQIQLYEYFPSGSQEPLVYFDTSRQNPLQVSQNWETTEFFYSSPRSSGGHIIFPLKQVKANAPPIDSMASPKQQFLEYVQQGKFQILHCGTDDFWGDFSNGPNGAGGELTVGASNTDEIPDLLFPVGPFIGDNSDTLTNFSTGTLEASQE